MRSELRRRALDTLSIIPYRDPKRPRVKKWSICPGCQEKVPKYLFQIDHQDPVIPIHQKLETMSFDQLIERMWCKLENLKPLCRVCHTQKTRQERKLRASFHKKVDNSK